MIIKLLTKEDIENKAQERQFNNIEIEEELIKDNKSNLFLPKSVINRDKHIGF